MYSEKAKGLNVVKYGAVEVKYMVTYNDSQPERAGQRKAWNERSEWSGRNCG